MGNNVLAQKYGLPSFSPIERWVKASQTLGEEGVRKKRTKQVIFVQFEVDVLKLMKQTGASYQNTEIQFMMNNPSFIAN